MILSWIESSAVQIHASVAAQTPMMMSAVTISGAVCGVSIDLQNGTSYPAQRLTRPRLTNGNVATNMNVRATRFASPAVMVPRATCDVRRWRTRMELKRPTAAPMNQICRVTSLMNGGIPGGGWIVTLLPRAECHAGYRLSSRKRGHAPAVSRTAWRRGLATDCAGPVTTGPYQGRIVRHPATRANRAAPGDPGRIGRHGRRRRDD